MSMDRRDFFLLFKRGHERVLELSCERLYMRWADARSGAGGPAREPTGSAREDAQPWGEEPPTDIVTVTSADLLDELKRELLRADVLRISGREWLGDADFRRDVETRVEAFMARGGRVE